MPDLWCDVDTAVIVPVNVMPLLDDTDFKSIETAVVYNSAGIDVIWNFVTCAGVVTGTAVTPTTGGNYDWSEPVADKGMYAIEIPASGGVSINNDTEGVGWFTGVATGVLPWRGPTIGFRRAALNDLLIEGGTASTNLEDFFDGTGYAGGTAKLGVDVISISGDTTAADNAELMFDGTGYAGGTAKLKVDLETIKTQAVTCAAGVTVLASVGTVATSTAQTGDSYAIINGASGCVAIKGDTAAILSDTGTDGVVVAAASKTGYALADSTSDAVIADAIWNAATATYGGAGSYGESVEAIAVDVAGLDGAAMRGTDSAALASVCTEARLSELDAGTPGKAAAEIDLIKTETAGLDGASIPTAAAVADAVWDEAIAGHAGVGSTGEALAGASAPTAAAVADAVWDEAATGHTDAGKAGAQLWTDIDAIAVDVAGLDGAAMRGTDSAALASVCTEGRLSELDAANLPTDVSNVKTDTAAILLDTGTDGVVVATASKTGYALSAAGVDAILDDAPAAELSAIPSTTGTLRQMIQFLFTYFRNKKTVTATTETLLKEDATTSLGTATVSDDGTTFTKGEMG